MEQSNMSLVPKEVITVIDSLKKQVEAQRLVYIKNTMEENRQKLSRVTLAKERRNVTMIDLEKNAALLLKRQNDAIKMQIGLENGNNGDDSNCSADDTAVLLGASVPVKNTVRAIRLPEVKRLPPYTTWMFLDRNQRMTEDQSVVGRRRIYYDPSGGEALICSDSEEEVIEEEDKKEFVQSEDYILRMTVQQVGLSDAVLDLLGQCFSKKPSDVKARYEVLCKEEKMKAGLGTGDAVEISENPNPYLDKDLEAALDSFDNLFCRRCYVFDCRLHGCSQDLIFPTEKQHPWSSPDEANEPCGQHCYRLAPKHERIYATNFQKRDGSEMKPIPSCNDASIKVSPRKKSIGFSNKRKGRSTQSGSASANARNVSDNSDSDDRFAEDNNSIDQSSIHHKNKLMGKSGTCKSKKKRSAERVPVANKKRHKKMLAQHDSTNTGPSSSRDMKLRSRARKEDEAVSSLQKKGYVSVDDRFRKDSLPVGSSKSLSCEDLSDPVIVASNDQSSGNLDDVSRKDEVVDESSDRWEVNNDKSWKPFEKALYEKGLEIFGRNSCLIARNLLNGLKTCSEVHQWMTHLNHKLSIQGGDGGTNFECNEAGGNEVRRRSRFVRRRGRVRRLKYSWKSTGYHSIRKRISERKDQPCRQYNPCGCESACGKQCPCLLNGTCCEKYCGCPKSCKNRFRGCHCAKSQCRSRQCPCFAADRECDPDVCRNCWVSCGDGTLGVPNQRGDNYGCKNMKLLLKQQQRGFRKVDPDRWEFANEGFLRGQKHLLKSITRRKPVHGHGQQHQQQAHTQTSSVGACVEVGKFGLEEEVERLKRDKNVLMQELVRLRQQQQTTDNQLQTMVQRLQGMEQRQQQMMSFLAKAVQSPGFLAQFVQQQSDSSRRISEANKKRRLKQDDASESETSNPPDGQIVKYQPLGNDSAHAMLRQLRNLDPNFNSNSDNFFIGDSSSTSVIEKSKTSGVTLQEVPLTSGPAFVGTSQIATGSCNAVVSKIQSSPVATSSENLSIPELPEISGLVNPENIPSISLPQTTNSMPDIPAMPDAVQNSNDIPGENYMLDETGDDEFMDLPSVSFEGTSPIDIDKLSPNIDAFLDDASWEQLLDQTMIPFENEPDMPNVEIPTEGTEVHPFENGWDKSHRLDQLTEQMGHLNSDNKSL